MVIGIIGYGVVGTATAELLRRLGHTVRVRDTDAGRMKMARSEGFGEIGQGEQVEVLFICVPERHVRDALCSAPDSPTTIVRSTVPPGTTESLSRELGRPLVFMPETLREATALWDALNPALILIGCPNKEQGERLAELFAPLMAPIALIPPATAEMVKLTLNAYLHTLISFWNEIQLICELTGLQSHIVGKLCSQDPRVSSYGAAMHGRPAGGTCLPKDIAQLIGFAEAKGYEPQLLEAVRDMNVRIEGHRDEVTDNGNRPHGRPGMLPKLQLAPVSEG